MGRFDDALAELDAIQGELPPGHSHEELRLMRSYLLSRAGRYHESQRILGEIRRKASDAGDGALLSATHLLAAILELEKNAPARALRAAENVAEALPEDGRLSRSLRALTELLLGIAASRTGDSERADEHLAVLESHYEPRDRRERWWYHLLLGETLLAKGEPRAAYTAFTEGAPRNKMPFNVTRLFENLSGALSFRDGAARAEALEGDRREAIALYEKLLRPDISLKWTAPLEPRYHVELARLHRALGKREEASRHYQKALSFWSDADPGLPELAEAEKYLAGS